MRKFLIVVLTPLLSIGIVIIKIPDVESWIKEKDEYGVLYIGAFLVLATLLIHIFNVISPLAKYERLEKKKWLVIESISEDFLEQYRPQGYHLAINIVVPKRVLWWHKREPKSQETDARRIRIWGKVFKVLWKSDHSINQRLKLSINQGVTGLAFKYGKPYIKDTTIDGFSGLNLNVEQLDVVKNVKFIISCPIYAYDDYYHRISDDKVIGVVNVSCSSPQAQLLIQDNRMREDLTKSSIYLSRVCSLIM